jgi:hypothetical protein
MAEEDTWTLALQKRDVGMPFKAVIREIGYEPEEIQQIEAEKDAESEDLVIADFGRDVEGEDAA